MSIVSPKSAPAAQEERAVIQALMQSASVEMTVHDARELHACRALLPPGTPVYVSFLPKQTWTQSVDTAAAVRAAGFEPIPHLPARELESRAQLAQVLGDLRRAANVRRLLLIAGDRAMPRGPLGSSAEVIDTGLLQACGIEAVAFAGHPEGSPRIAPGALRAAERDKIEAARRAGLAASFLTQFCFSAEPVIDWVRQLRARGIDAPVVAGLAGPARLATLVRYATLCGVGPSLRALTGRSGALARLAGTHGPEPIVRALARAAAAGALDLAGIHFFTFGGLARTCAWRQAAADGRFELLDETFRVAADAN
ncbi:MAG TPA: hypothetical protein VF203_12080 [Burkholderiales bacterium]